MITMFFPVKKLRRNGKYVLFGAVLLLGVLAVYHEMIAAKAWTDGTGGTNPDDGSSWKAATLDQRVRVGHSLEDSNAGFLPQSWIPQFKGQANLHVFEDWCGSSTAGLRHNLHYPLYPHSRTTVRKLAVSPQWTNYGLRIFGYIHPYTDGEFVFALSSDDTSEFWLSTDDSPSRVALLAWVGKTGSEWTAPGEFEKYASQISKPTRLSAQRRYFFEVIHKQNDKGSDHVEVAWKLLDEKFRFLVIDSKYISLYVNESALLMSHVAHIPQTPASHRRPPPSQHSAAADMLKEDPRDALHQVPLMEEELLQGVLPDCLYKPSYTIKDFPLTRYQGLQFVHMSYIYPKDYTRLTHMEEENSCFYPENPSYMKLFGFSRYMRLDTPDAFEKDTAGDYSFQRRKSVLEDDDDDVFGNDAYPRDKAARRRDTNPLSDYGDDYDDYVSKRRRKLFSLGKANDALERSAKVGVESTTGGDVAQPRHLASSEVYRQERPPRVKAKGPGKEVVQPKGKLKPAKRVKPQQIIKRQKPETEKNYKRGSDKMTESHIGTVTKTKEVVGESLTRTTVSQQLFQQANNKSSLLAAKPRDTDRRRNFMDKELEMNMHLLQDIEDNIRRAKVLAADQKWSGLDVKGGRVEAELHEQDRRRREMEVDDLWGPGGDFEGFDDEDVTPAPVFDAEVDWSQTFQVNHLDLQAMRSDWIDLHCNISGNLLLHSSDALPVVQAFMEQLNDKHEKVFTLVRVVNVEKRVDGVQGSRYLLELELKDDKGRLLRLSHYVYALNRPRTRPRAKDFSFRRRPAPEILLCNPVSFSWNPLATVHFIVPVKNQARWVQQLIDDMADLFKATGDSNFNVIIVDYNSTDMDVRTALQKSSLPRYQYMKLSGNFERSAGLQAGINLINDDHSIVFLCDLHIHFPPSIIDSIRKHCVEGFMAFAPIVLRLDCGATPFEGRGYWEVNGFGLLGIYKSDLEAVGGMNTKEFTNRWGGEDWELLDRILQGGLEVERIFLRNFFHHYHSKRGMWNRRMSPGPR
ncbi:N-acetyl-beta-glucosaminyl-glycoprotein 4-beta-N-acetylgalactosaminyltransferase 1 isoform X1 [Entelurus aequoreus]|uniref:N-acetyl-beta-glucosaminyl-glycoprotein 4-beta-N-acetylgalactosaminyltransferase 1 isoform X1 n=1 Tax=Entelurus aequoreus TaxID=161455 RepID=UPI002B1E4075|nr:N-acetyl-beta-glucosaminyl-glycoprotein 4-beta-N-acetylgalactosaminyltransferase 1 isoform X1 [Entelurus aequoreus]